MAFRSLVGEAAEPGALPEGEGALHFLEIAEVEPKEVVNRSPADHCSFSDDSVALPMNRKVGLVTPCAPSPRV